MQLLIHTPTTQVLWNKGKLTGQKPPFKLKEIGAIRVRLQLSKRERVNRRKHVTRAEARADIFDYIEWFYNQRKRRQLNGGNIHQTTLN